MTEASATRLFEEAFGKGQVEVRPYGNVLACCAFLMGLATEDLEAEELDSLDRYFPLILGVRAVKPVQSALQRIVPTTSATEEPAAAILLYHSIGQRASDRWRLGVSTAHFRDQIAHLVRSFRVVPLAQLVAELRAGILHHRSIALTFDDGYLDNLETALPILRKRAAAATFFISGEGALGEQTFWWEELDARATAAGINETEFQEIHSRLMKLGTDERRRVLASLPGAEVHARSRMRAEDLSRLASDPLAEIGAHGWSHRALGGLPEHEQVLEIQTNIQELSKAATGQIRFLAYPFGGPYDEITVRLLRNQGITAACTVEEKRVTRESDLMQLPRFEVGNWSGKDLQERLDDFLHG
jgi:peptidoglycan/xylan/chitin deacetylase (PgdA/CDA1 family)